MSSTEAPIPPGVYSKITVRTEHVSHTFTGRPELHVLNATGTYFVTMSDKSHPSGREVVWQQRVENGRVEGVEITVEP